MKLTNISEGVRHDVSELKELLYKVFSFVPDIDQLTSHIMNGCRYPQLLITYDQWWDQLPELLAPIPPDVIQTAAEDTVRYMQKALQKQQPVTESIISGVISILKNIMNFVMNMSSHSTAGYGGHPQQRQNPAVISNWNIQTVGQFLTYLEPTAIEILKKTPMEMLGDVFQRYLENPHYGLNQ